MRGALLSSMPNSVANKTQIAVSELLAHREGMRVSKTTISLKGKYLSVLISDDHGSCVFSVGPRGGVYGFKRIS